MQFKSTHHERGLVRVEWISHIKELVLISLTCLQVFAAQEAPVSNVFQDAFVTHILKGDVPAVRTHLEEYPNDIDYRNMSKETTLMLAIKSNSVPMFMEILGRTKKERLEEKDKFGRTALIWVSKVDIENDNVTLFAQLLLQQGAKIEAQSIYLYTPLMEAAEAGNFELVKLFLSNEYYRNNKDAINKKDNKGFTAFNWALVGKQRENIQIISKYLLEHGAIINSINNDGVTALFKAIAKCDIELVEFLIDNNADVNFVVDPFFVDKRFHRPLTWAIGLRKQPKLNLKEYNELYDIILFLLEKGANFQAMNNPHQANGTIASALDTAINCGDFEVVRLLVLKNADINERVNGKKLLELAKEEYEKEIDEEKKEERRKIYEFLKEPLTYLFNENKNINDRAVSLQASLFLRDKYKFPSAIADIVITYLEGPTLENEIEENKLIVSFNKIIRLIAENKDLTQLLDIEPEVVLLKDSEGMTPLLFAIEKQNIFAIAKILEKLLALKFNNLKEINKKEYAIQSAVPKQEDNEELEKLKEYKINLENSLAEQFKMSMEIANKAGNQQIINLLKQYCKLMQAS